LLPQVFQGWTPRNNKAPAFLRGLRFVWAPDERYVSGRPDFPGVWIMVENSVYPN
jgi:hypothetical protein